MATVYKNFIACTNPAVPDVIAYHPSIELDFNAWYVNWYAETISKPSWVTEYTNGLGSVTSYKVNYSGLTPSAGDYEISLRVRRDTGAGEVIDTFTINIAMKNECPASEALCCSDDAIVIRWLSRTGGIKEWRFNGVKTYDVSVGDAIAFKNSDLQAQYAQRSGIYTGKLITSGDITQAQADFLDELKYSIQAWEWDGETATPILIENNSFLKYKSTDKFYDVSLKYVIAQEVIMQTQ